MFGKPGGMGGLGGYDGLRPEDFDLAARTVLGEAANQPLEGQAAVAHVIANRLRSGRYGSTVPDILFAKSQFEPWSTRRDELMAIPTSDPRYRQALDVAKVALRGMAPDPTGGATHFYAPKAQAALGRRPPSWDDGSGFDIGDHRFFRLDAGPGQVARRGDQPPAVGSPAAGDPGLPAPVRVASADPSFAPDSGSVNAVAEARTFAPPRNGGMGGLGGAPGVDVLGRILGAVGTSLLTSPRHAPFAGVPDALQAQEAQRLRQAQLAYEREKDARDYGLRREQLDFSRANTAEDNRRAWAQFDESKLTPAAKAARDMGLTPGTTEYNQFLNQQYKPGNKFGVIAEDEFGTKRYGWINESTGAVTPFEAVTGAAAPASGARAGDAIPPAPPGADPKIWRAEKTKEAAERGKPLPGEQAGRVALAETYLNRAPAIREQIAAGFLTGPLDSTAARSGWGERGQVFADIETGIDALRRGLTGAGMPQSEADDYARRYAPTRSDTAATLLRKHDRLVEELTAIRGKLYEGRKAPPLDAGKPGAGTTRSGVKWSIER